jgi:LuxR family maltose regulon positive regulatory protein
MRKTLALLAYLSLTPQPPTRETLATLFWPEYDQQHALSNLRRNLSSLAGSLPPTCLDVDRERVGLRGSQGIEIDVERFHRLLAGAEGHAHETGEMCPECLGMREQAVRLYRGDFFEGFNLKDCPEFDDWQFFQREGLRGEYGGVLEKLAGYYQGKGEWERGILHARSWLALDRLHEPAQRMLMGLYGQSGQKSAALRQYEECKRLMEQELGQPPETDTTLLYEEIRKESFAAARLEPIHGDGNAPERTTDIPLTKKVIHRPRLVSLLNQSIRMPLTLISASAGFGKTTLLAEWIAQSQDLIAWVSLDSSDNNPYRIVDCIANSILNVLPGTKVASAALKMLHTPQPVQISVILGSLINDLVALPHNLILILDDYHQIDSPAAHSVINFILDHLPENLHLIISTRSDPPISLGRLRANLQLSDIRTNDLRFTSDETQLFLTQAIGFPLSAQDMVSFEDKVEGWIAGIQLAALAIQSSQLSQSSSELRNFIRSFKGSHRYILDYLIEEVLNHQPEELRMFLLKTSVLDSMCASLCDSILVYDEGTKPEGDHRENSLESISSRPSAAILEYLDRANLFLVPLDDERIWYRYHHLFSDLLLQRLRQTWPEMMNELYLRAATWQEENGYLENAIRYALKAKDYQLATRLMDQIKVNLWSHGEVRMMLHWLKTMPEELIRSQPELSLDYAACLTLAGYFDDAEKWLQFTEDGYRQMDSYDQQASLRAQIMVPVYRSGSARLHGDYSRAIALGELALHHVPHSDVRYKGSSLLFLGQAHFFAGNTEKADQIISEAVGLNLASVHPAIYLCVRHDLAQLRVLQGRLREAREIYEQAQRSIKERGITIFAGTEYSGLGDLKREWNKLQAASQDIHTGIEMAEASDHAFFLLDAYLAGVRLAWAQKDWDAAWNCLQKAEAVVLRCPTSTEIETIRAWQARMHLVQGNLAEAEQWAEKKAGDGEVSYGPQKEFELLSRARIWLALGKTSQAASLLSRICIVAESSGRYGRLLEAQMLQALVSLADGKEALAIVELSEVFANAEPEGYVRLFLDEGEPMRLLLSKWLAQAGSNTLCRYASDLFAQFGTGAGKH